MQVFFQGAIHKQHAIYVFLINISLKKTFTFLQTLTAVNSEEKSVKIKPHKQANKKNTEHFDYAHTMVLQKFEFRTSYNS